MSFVAAADFVLQSGADVLVDYQFNKHVIHHLFCRVCGIKSFARGRGAGGAEMVAINTRCLDDIDVSTLQIKPIDGKRL